MSQPVPYQAPVVESGSNLVSQPWQSYFNSLDSGNGSGNGAEQVSWIPEQGPVSPHGRELSFTGSISRSIAAKAGERISVADFGAVGDGGTDDAPAFNLAIQAAINKPGCEIYIPGGYRYLINSSLNFNGGSTPLSMCGDGSASVILCGSQVPNGEGFLDIRGSDVTLRNFLIDGQKSAPDRLQYNQDFQGIGGNDPMAASLAQGTSIWVHAGCARVILDGLIIQHTRGYAVLYNATEGQDIWDCDVRNCWFLNNRPALFGLSGDLNYGGWNGGIMLHGDGRSGAPFMVRGLSVSNCHWRRCSGNAVWSHLYGFASLHENIRISNNDFVDNGLDCIQFGGVCGGVCVGNFARRVGYICSDDGATPGVPKWLNGAWASFLDTSGQVIGVDYCGNTGISINGDGINLDGYSNGTVAGNTLRQPLPDEPEYIVDQIGVSGFAGSSTSGGPNFAHGMLSSNTSNDLPGGDSIVVVGNTVLNFSCGAILLYAGRRCVIQSNNIEHPANATEVPIVLGNVGTGAQQRTYDSAVYGNRIGWLPTSVRPCIREDASIAPFSPGDSNHVGVNTIIPVSGNAYGFQSASSSSSKTEVRFDSNQPGLAFPSYYFMQSEGAADSSVLRWYYAENQNAPAIAMQLQSRYGTGLVGPLFNISNNGAAHTGVISTANKVNSAIPDTMLSGHMYCDGFMILTDAAYSDADANVFDGTWGMIRYRPSVGHLEQSISVSGGTRVWSALGGTPGGPINAVQVNRFNAFYGETHFTYNPDTQQLQVGDLTSFGSGVISMAFNATATGGQNAVQSSGGSFHITGGGDAFFQTCSVTTTFNSLATGGTSAIQQHDGAFVIFGNGNAQFQTMTANAAVAAVFNATATGGSTAIQQQLGTFRITGGGDSFFQTCSVTTTFNSSATGATSAIQQASGTFTITGAGDASFQTVRATGVFNSAATGGTAAFQQASGTFVIYGNGTGAFQEVDSNVLALSITGAPSPQSGRAVIYADPSNQLMVSFNGGAFQALGSGGGGGGTNTINIQAGGVGIGTVSTINFSTNLGVGISGGVATVTAAGGSTGGISGVKTSDGAAYGTSGNYVILSFINSAGLINTSAISVSGTCNAANYQVNGSNGDTVNVSYTGLDGGTHTLSFFRGILIGHS